MSEELKVALIGSAPASVHGAPYRDPSWQVWGCSPGAYGIVPKGRSNVWFEMHKYEPGQPWFSPEYCQFLRDHSCVVVSELRKEIPNGIMLDYQYLVKKYSAYFFTSSIAWMMAHAIELGAKKIGLWGVDMAANEEYEGQRAGLHYFALIAAQLGIEVGVPHESDLFRPRFLYGLDEVTHSHLKMRARRIELTSRLQQAEAVIQAKQQEAWFLRGAVDDLNYCFNTWPDKEAHLGPPVIEAQVIAQPSTQFQVSGLPEPKRKSKANGEAKIAAASLGPGHLV